MIEGNFNCSICGDTSHKICIYCTKDACNIHLCHRCMRCSECCHCDMPTNEEAEEPEAAPEHAPALEIPTLVP